MVPYRRTIELSDGVKVDLLFTPHLYSYKGRGGITFEATAGDARQMAEYFADLLYCAALNAWEIDEGMDPDQAPFKRGDFHALIVGSPRELKDCIDFALRALTGKTAKELAADAEAKEKEGTKEDAADVKKKLFSHLTGRRSKVSS